MSFWGDACSIRLRNGCFLLELAGALHHGVTVIGIAAVAYDTHATLAAAAFFGGLCAGWRLSARAVLCIIRTRGTFVPVTK